MGHKHSKPDDEESKMRSRLRRLKKTPIAVSIFPVTSSSEKNKKTPSSKKDARVPKALIKQKEHFLTKMKLEQIRSAKKTIKLNK